MEKSEQIGKLASALCKAQKEMGNAVKDSKNPFFKSFYADLNSVREACLPPLNNNGISAIQPTVCIEGKNYVQTILLHESGEYISSLTEIICSKVNDAQSHGSGLTYARRYGLQSIVNIGADDDDGNAASQPQPAKKVEAPKGLPFLEKGSENWGKVVDYLLKGGSIADIKKKYQLLEMHETELAQIKPIKP